LRQHEQKGRDIHNAGTHGVGNPGQLVAARDACGAGAQARQLCDSELRGDEAGVGRAVAHAHLILHHEARDGHRGREAAHRLQRQAQLRRALLAAAAAARKRALK
jgi:hypothetical protein